MRTRSSRQPSTGSHEQRPAASTEPRTERAGCAARGTRTKHTARKWSHPPVPPVYAGQRSFPAEKRPLLGPLVGHAVSHHWSQCLCRSGDLLDLVGPPAPLFPPPPRVALRRTTHTTRTTREIPNPAIPAPEY